MSSAVFTPTPDPLLIDAADALAAKLGLDKGQVTIHAGETRGDDWIYTGPRDAENTTVRFDVYAKGADLDGKDGNVEKELRAKLNAVPEMAIAQWTKTPDLVAELKTQIDAATAGTDFSDNLKNWLALDPKVAKGGRNFADYAASDISDNGFGIEVNVVVPRGDGEGWKEKTEKVAEQMNARKEEMRAILTDRIVERSDTTKKSYYRKDLEAEGKTKEQADAIVSQAKTDMGNLVITATPNEYSGVTISLRSPKQAELIAKGGVRIEPDNSVELKAANPLQHVISREVTKENPHPQLQKGLSTAILQNADRSVVPYFSEVAGSHDTMVAYAREFNRVEKTRPDLKPKFDAILASPVFKDHTSWVSDPSKKDAAPPEPTFRKPIESNDTFQISVGIKREQLKDMVNNLAGVTKPSVVIVDQAAPVVEQPPVAEAATSAVVTAAPATSGIAATLAALLNNKQTVQATAAAASVTTAAPGADKNWAAAVTTVDTNTKTGPSI